MKFFPVLIASYLFTVAESLRVAVIGPTGNIGRSVVKELSQQNIPTRCLLRHDISTIPQTETPTTSAEVAASLASLHHVEMVKGDVTDVESIKELVKDCDVVMALQGPPRPNPLLSLFPIFSNQNDPAHPYMTNYVGVKNIILAAKATSSVKRIVRLTGKGEDPFSIFSILINMLGFLAKGWNYEGEQLLRESGLEYTIVRPGILKDPSEYPEPQKARGLTDNGGDMKVSLVTYDQIAQLCVDSIKFDHIKKCTLSAMNVDENAGEDDYKGLLQKVQDDRREFKSSLIDKHRKGARVGFACLTLFCGIFLSGLRFIVG